MQPYLQFEFNDKDGNKHPLQFTNPVEVLETRKLDEIPAIFNKVEAAVQERFYVAGYLSYEAAPAFDSKMHVHHRPELPLVWFGLFKEPVSQEISSSNGEYQLSDWKLDGSIETYKQGIKQIKRAIEEGDTYQVNYTARMKAGFTGDDQAFYHQLARNQQAGYSAYLNLGRYRILSASPELFFRIDDRKIMTKPMKGTAARGRFTEEDNARRAHLRRSEKEQAENVMIVDLLRNDIGRIAKPGSVTVPHLFEVETYPTVHQMTSTIEAELEEGTAIFDWFRALFPCGSITGAPKRSTMEYISRLEDAPREVYCGAIGYITPERQAVFNVPIRTVLVDSEKQTATYGVGGGITWDSTAEGEYEELQTKAKLLTERRPDFQLLESLKLENGHYPLLKYHLERLADSARYFSFSIQLETIESSLAGYAREHTDGSYKVRLLVDRHGKTTVEGTKIQPVAQPVTCALAASPVDSADPFLFHKTTHREVYHKHQKGLEDGFFSVLLWNEKGELTEFAIGNLVIEKSGKYFTPPITCGLLGGTFRKQLLENEQIQEKVLYKKELEEADTVWLINGVRGWVKVTLS